MGVVEGKARTVQTISLKVKKWAVPKQTKSTLHGQAVGPLKVGQYQIWIDLLAAGSATKKTARQPLDVVLTLVATVCQEVILADEPKGKSNPSETRGSDTGLLLPTIGSRRKHS